jgi:hypothetical protein
MPARYPGLVPGLGQISSSGELQPGGYVTVLREDVSQGAAPHTPFTGVVRGSPASPRRSSPHPFSSIARSE